MSNKTVVRNDLTVNFPQETRMEKKPNTEAIPGFWIDKQSLEFRLEVSNSKNSDYENYDIEDVRLNFFRNDFPGKDGKLLKKDIVLCKKLTPGPIETVKSKIDCSLIVDGMEKNFLVPFGFGIEEKLDTNSELAHALNPHLHYKGPGKLLLVIKYRVNGEEKSKVYCFKETDWRNFGFQEGCHNVR